MSYALTVETGRPAVYQVMCANCMTNLGTMTGETITRAIQKRGPIICPECRDCKCDYCGYIGSRRLNFYGGSVSPICGMCIFEQRNEKPPQFPKTVIFPKRNAEMMLPPGRLFSSIDMMKAEVSLCLSSYSNFHKMDKGGGKDE